MANLVQNLRIARFAAAEFWTRALHVSASPYQAIVEAMEPKPDRLLIAPQDIRTSDPTIAEDIYAGYFAFAGRIVNAHGRSPFDLDAPSPNWARGLLGFGRLRYLRAADTALARANARALVDDFIAAAPRLDPTAHEPRVAARRLISMLSQSPAILEGADREFYRRFLRHLARSRGRLRRMWAWGAQGEARLQIALALAYYAVCAQGPAWLERRATRRLAREIDAQILPDGGHVSRNPRPIVEFLLDFLPLRQAYAARGLTAPPSLLNAIDRMMPMLRMFRHGDGALALFNGMGVTAPDSLAIALAYDDAHAQPNVNARHSGYQRMEANGVVVLMDAGAPPPRAFSTDAHAGCLAFEMSDRECRVVVNCGAPEATRADLRLAARSTAAHATLVIQDTSSCYFAKDNGLEELIYGQIVDGPRRVTMERAESAQGMWVDASHDGYARRFGLIHARRLALASDGAVVAGEDRLRATTARRGAQEADFTIRFHLHPNVEAQMEGGEAVTLRLANGRVWRFTALDQAVTLEESVFFAAANGARPTLQIVVAARSFGEARVPWSFTRVS